MQILFIPGPIYIYIGCNENINPFISFLQKVYQAASLHSILSYWIELLLLQLIYYHLLSRQVWNDNNNTWYIVLTLTVLVVTIDAQWEGMGDAGTISPMPDHKGFKLQ